MKGETYSLAGALCIIKRSVGIPVTVLRIADNQRFYIPNWYRVRQVLMAVFDGGRTQVQVFQVELPA